jgi:hypothetical protein
MSLSPLPYNLIFFIPTKCKTKRFWYLGFN